MDTYYNILSQYVTGKALKNLMSKVDSAWVDFSNLDDYSIRDILTERSIVFLLRDKTEKNFDFDHITTTEIIALSKEERFIEDVKCMINGSDIITNILKNLVYIKINNMDYYNVDSFIEKLLENKQIIKFNKFNKQEINWIYTKYGEKFSHDEICYDKINISKSWNVLLDIHGDKIYDKFLSNLNNMLNQTETRSVFCENPQLLKYITVDHIDDSKLSKKQWILLLSRPPIKEYFNSQKKRAISKKVVEHLRVSSTIEVLSGVSSTSKRFNNALGGLQEDEIT